ncbi:MAG: thioredoxin family protein [Alphaproteobacteria bacterium]
MSHRINTLILAFGFMVGLLGLSMSWPATTVSAAATPKTGDMAPNFTATDIHGEPFNLEDHKDKIVVLEWTNHECPFVKKHYETNNMQEIQKTATDKGVAWISIVSSAPGNQGYVSAEEAVKIVEEVGANATTRILDTTGEIGRLYGAKTTPHMFVINKGVLAYAGAIDDNPSANPDTVEGAENLVLKAIDEIKAGEEVSVASTQPYGCSVKY